MRFIEDTNVISNAASDPAALGRLEQLRRDLKGQGFDHAVTPILLLELLNGLSKMSDAHFPSNQFRFRLLCEPTTWILPSPHNFVMRTVLGLESPKSSLREPDFKEWLEIVCCAQSLSELRNGNVSIDSANPRRYGIELDEVARYVNDNYRRWLSRMNAFRQGQNSLPFSKEDWIRTLLKLVGFIQPSPYEVAALVNPLDAAYRHDQELLRLASESNYNFEGENRHGDAIDAEYLLYLADPGIRFITHDGRIKQRVKGSPQENQIIVFSQS